MRNLLKICGSSLLVYIYIYIYMCVYLYITNSVIGFVSKWQTPEFMAIFMRQWSVKPHGIVGFHMFRDDFSCSTGCPPPVISWFITHLNIVISIIHYCCYSYKPTYYYYRAPSCLIIVQAKTNPIARRCKGQASYVDLLTLMHDQTRSRGNGTSLMERNVHQFCHALPSSKLT